jgi:hypothetical protein
LQPLRWHARHVAGGLGLPGWLGLLLVLGSVALLFGSYLPARAEAMRLRQQASAQARGNAAMPVGGAHVTAAEQLGRFNRGFAQPQQLAASVGKIKAAAVRNGVVLAQGEFRLIKDTEGGLSRYQIVLPVKAGYRNTRAFVRDMLRDLPGCALEEVNFRRDDAQSGVLDTQLRMTLFVFDPS